MLWYISTATHGPHLWRPNSAETTPRHFPGLQKNMKLFQKCREVKIPSKLKSRSQPSFLLTVCWSLGAAPHPAVGAADTRHLSVPCSSGHWGLPQAQQQKALWAPDSSPTPPRAAAECSWAVRTVVSKPSTSGCQAQQWWWGDGILPRHFAGPHLSAYLFLKCGICLQVTLICRSGHTHPI